MVDLSLVERVFDMISNHGDRLAEGALIGSTLIATLTAVYYGATERYGSVREAVREAYQGWKKVVETCLLPPDRRV